MIVVLPHRDNVEVKEMAKNSLYKHYITKQFNGQVLLIVILRLCCSSVEAAEKS